MDGAPSFDLRIERFFRATPAQLWRAWSEPELLARWFAPAPMRTRVEILDMRAGGTQRLVMTDPTGKDYPVGGVFLEVVPQRRIVATDAYREAWVPSEKPFMTSIVEFVPEGTGTRYSAIARHWSEADRATHEAMGFHQGWGICADQLGALAESL